MELSRLGDGCALFEGQYRLREKAGRVIGLRLVQSDEIFVWGGGGDALMGGPAAFNLFDARPEAPSLFLFPERGFGTGVVLVDDVGAGMKGGPELEPLAMPMSLSTTAVGDGIAKEGMGVTGREAKSRRCEDGDGERRGVNGRGEGGEERGVPGHDGAGEGGREGGREGREGGRMGEFEGASEG